MSKYTTEVRFICEHYAGLDESEGYANVEEIIERARPKVFDFDYPIFDSSYKPILETKILKHYYTREIGFETVGLWKLKLNMLMNEIMPYYNKMYESELIEFDPFTDVDKRIEHEGSDNGTKNTDATSTSNGSLEGVRNDNSTTVSNGTFNGRKEDESETVYEGEKNEWDLYSDTPQGGISGIEDAYDGVSNNAYLTDARNIKDEENSTTNVNATEVTTNADSNTTTFTNRTTNNESTENTTNTDVDETHSNQNRWVEIIKGKQGSLSYSKLLEEFRNTFLNIDMMIIEELNGLFFMLW